MLHDLPHPNFILNTSPHKYQTVWKVTGFTPDSAEMLLRALARDAGADIAVTDVARVLRIPSFDNHKYTPPHQVTAHSYHSNRFTAAAFPALIDAPSILLRPTPPTPPRQQGADRRDHSRSGVDFGRTIGWLEHGVSHDEIVHRLMTERPDKPNPEYYARRTLQNALRAYQFNPHPTAQFQHPAPRR